MVIGIVALVVIIVLFLILKNIISLGLKIVGFVILLLAVAGTIYICSNQPDMHKPFSLNTIEYLFKVNKDGSLTTTKQVTHTIYKEQAN